MSISVLRNETFYHHRMKTCCPINAIALPNYSRMPGGLWLLISNAVFDMEDFITAGNQPRKNRSWGIWNTYTARRRSRFVGVWQSASLLRRGRWQPRWIYEKYEIDAWQRDTATRKGQPILYNASSGKQILDLEMRNKHQKGCQCLSQSPKYMPSTHGRSRIVRNQ